MTEIEARFILGLGPTYSKDDLKRAYRKTAADNHPDRGGNLERMVLVNQAFDVLTWTPPSPPMAAPTPTRESPLRDPASVPRTNADHPFDKYVVRVSAGFAVVMWITGLTTADYDDREELWSFVFLGLPLFYVLFFFLTRFVVGCGIRLYNLGIRIDGWIGTFRARIGIER